MFKGYYLQAFIIVLAQYVFLNVPAMLVDTFIPDSYVAQALVLAYRYLTTGSLWFACAIFFLCNFRQQRVGFNSLMYGFDYFQKCTVLYLSIAVRILIGCVVFIFPGVLAALKYSQAFFIMVDDPSKSPRQCMAESAKMMDGNKRNYISLLLSYAVFFIVLVVLPFILAVESLPPVSYEQMAVDPYVFEKMADQVATSPWTYIGRFTGLIVTTRVLTGQAAFYDIYSGNLIITDEVLPDEGQDNDETL